MQIGVIFPQTEIGPDRGAVRAFAVAVEEFGFRHLLAYDHVVGADPEVHAPWRGAYDADSSFHEPLVLFGYLSALTSLEFVTGVLILPQRQTALVAKQAAEVDILSGGRLRLGVGIGWNSVEYNTLGHDFHTRGRRLDEQIPLLRRLWTERTVTFEGRDDTMVGVGINPLPVRRPLPIWVGARSAPAYRRVGRLANGWFPILEPGAALGEARRTIEEAALEAGRDPAGIGMEARVRWDRHGKRVPELVDQWRAAGATHLTIHTMGAGLGGVDGHVNVLAEVARALGLRGAEN